MEKTNCPNCGMPITGEKCDYCGSVFIDWAVIDMNTPVFIKFRHNGRILRAKCIMSSLDMHIDSPTVELYSDNHIYTTMQQSEKTELDIHLYCVPFETANGLRANYMVIEEDKVDQDTLKEVI